MRPLILSLVLTGCSQPAPPPPVSPCHEERFEGAGFTVCAPGTDAVEISTGQRSFAALQAALGPKARRVAFAMNAGMFDEAGQPIGLMIDHGRIIHAINRRKGGGNFHLAPNGVFLIRTDGRGEVVTSDRVGPLPTIAFATQSGPMLLIAGKLHPRITPDGDSHFVRNAVGIDHAGHPLFVITVDAVSFGKLARFFRDRLGVRDALYLDGSVSSLWDPANGRMDSFAELGPMIVAFKPAASAPGRAARATP